MLRMFENKSDARTRAHSQSCRETVDMSADTFRTKCFWSAHASPHRFHPYRGFVKVSRLLKAQHGGTGPIFFQYWRMRPLEHLAREKADTEDARDTWLRS